MKHLSSYSVYYLLQLVGDGMRFGDLVKRDGLWYESS